MLDLSQHYAPVPKPSKVEKVSPKVSTKRVTPVRRRNVLRHKENWLRAYGSIERVIFVSTLACIACGKTYPPSQNSHIINGGLSRKADAKYIVPCCLKHHEELDEGNGREAFEKKYNLKLKRLARITELAYREYQRSSA